MAVSTNPEFVSTRSDLIRDAFALLNIYGASESIDANDYELANRFLNRMVKTWMSQGYHLWLKQTAFLFTRKDQSLYKISSNSSDNITLNYNETLLTENAAAAANTIKVNDISNIELNDNIGIILDNNDIFWTRVAALSLPPNNSVILVDDLTSIAREGSKVYNYSSKLENPLNIYSAVRNDNNIDTPMNSLSYEEYFQLPNKTAPTSTPVSYNYDRQLEEAIIRLWTTPNRTIIIKFTLSRKTYNFDINSNEPDFPMEWHEAIVYNLAIRIAPSFGKNKDEGFQMLATMASQFLQNALSFDNEGGSLYFRPDFHYG